MLLCIIIKITLLNTIHYIICTFLSVKIIDNYYWVLGTIKKLYEFFNIPNSKVIIINANFNIIYAILKEFSLTSHLLYL